MKQTSIILALAGSAALTSQPVSAANVTNSDPLTGGIAYTWTVAMGGLDSALISGHVGPWSWEDEELGTPDTGWAHESQWIAVTLSQPVMLTLRLQSKADEPDPAGTNGVAGGNLFPGVTIWSGWDNDGTMSHSYYNKGAVPWAEDLTYFTHIPGGSGHSIEGTWSMPAGQYTFVFGGNSTSTAAEPRQGYAGTFTSSPIPEPSSLLLLATATLPFVLRRRRC